jgi:hypothetical protein
LRRTGLILAALLACAHLPASTLAAPAAKLHVSLNPEQLGHSTNLSFRLHIDTSRGQPPTPVAELDLIYPSSLGLAVGELGLVSCLPIALERLGVPGCSPNALMGRGHAIAEVSIDGELNSETAEIAVVRAPEQEGHIAMYFYIEGRTPLATEIVDPGTLLPTSDSSQEALQIKVPQLRLGPEGPWISLVQLDATIGPNGLTYQERSHGRTVKYKPTGILLPNSCPHGGFRFTAEVIFITGAHATTHTRVPCPKTNRHR